MSAKIESYAVIGDCRTTALVGLDGSIDWLCLPEFSADACFAALLGTPENGRWQITPVDAYTPRRKYRGDTLILETTFTTADGEATVIDFMPPEQEDTRQEIDVIRIVRPVRGTVKFTTHFTLRFDYGQRKPWVQKVDGGIRAIAGHDAVVLRTPVTMRGEGFHSVGDFEVSEGGGDVTFVMTYFSSHRPLPPARNVKKDEKRTDRFWTGWSGQYKCQHQWGKEAMRSLLALKALTYGPTGCIVAAATTSLPESLGGSRNWDYRYCWIRDATLTLFAFIHHGYTTEGVAWRDWLLRAVAGDPAGLQIMYGIHGEKRLAEYEATWLPGYGGSRPVRIGNAAHEQFQLDVFGELMGAMHLGRRMHEEKPVKGAEEGLMNAWCVQRSLMKLVEERWNEPDNGIWEVRGEKQHFVHSKVMAWMAVDRSIRDAEHFNFKGPIEKWKNLREQIHADVCQRGFDSRRNTFTQHYGSKTVDAALLLIPRTGFLPADDPRFIGTVKEIEKQLLVQDTFVLRYRNEGDVDGLDGEEAAFLPCSFWLAEAYAVTGRRQKGVQLFERLLKLCNDVGLISEEYDFKRKRQMGNFPQAFTHVALLATAALLGGERQAATMHH